MQGFDRMDIGDMQPMDFYNKIPGQIKPLTDTYSSLYQHPGERLNEIGQSYQQSPGFQFALQQALQGANHASAAGGMAGSPQSMQQNMGIATNLANQDYNNWIKNALGLYGTGLGGAEHANDTMAQLYAQEGNLKFNQDKQYDSDTNALFGNLFKGFGAAFGGGL